MLVSVNRPRRRQSSVTTSMSIIGAVLPADTINLARIGLPRNSMWSRRTVLDIYRVRIFDACGSVSRQLKGSIGSQPLNAINGLWAMPFRATMLGNTRLEETCRKETCIQRPSRTTGDAARSNSLQGEWEEADTRESSWLRRCPHSTAGFGPDT